MKLSAGLRLSDLFPELKTLFEIYVLGLLSSEDKHIFSANSLDDIFEAWKRSGVDSLEIYVSANMTELQIKKALELFRHYNFTVGSIHQSQAFKQVVSISYPEIEKLFEVADIFSAEVVVLHVDAIGKKIFNPSFVNDLKKLEKRYGIIAALENSPKYLLTLTKSFAWNDNDYASIITDNDLHMTLDTTHLAQVGGNIVAFYTKYKDRIVNIHISDYESSFLSKKLLLATGQHLSLGKGELPITSFLQTVKNTRYNGLVTMEIDTSLTGLCENARFIKNIIE